MTANAAAIAAYLRRLADLIDGDAVPAECHVVEDTEIVLTEDGYSHTEHDGGTAIAVVVGENRDKLVRRIKAELGE